MSEEIALASADRAELARLTTEVRGLRAIVDQRDRALESAHAKIAALLAELDAARAVVAAARPGVGGIARQRAVAAYDRVVKAL